MRVRGKAVEVERRRHTIKSRAVNHKEGRERLDGGVKMEVEMMAGVRRV
jgi:hypothetical protein